MASTAVVVGSQFSLSLSLPRKGIKRVAGRSAVSAAPCRPVVSASERLGGRPAQKLSFIGAAPESKKRFSSIIVKASEQADPSDQASELLKSLQESWNKVDDKLAIGGLGFASLILLWASTGLIGALDKLPLIPDFFEFVGILFSGWFTYRYLLFKPDREELLKIIDEAKGKITGNRSGDATTSSRNRVKSKKSIDSASGGTKRPIDGVGLEEQASALEDIGTGERGQAQASNGVRRLGRDDDRTSSEWVIEGTVVGEWRGFSDLGLDDTGITKLNGTARPDISV